MSLCLHAIRDSSLSQTYRFLCPANLKNLVSQQKLATFFFIASGSSHAFWTPLPHSHLRGFGLLITLSKSMRKKLAGHVLTLQPLQKSTQIEIWFLSLRRMNLCYTVYSIHMWSHVYVRNLSNNAVLFSLLHDFQSISYHLKYSNEFECARPDFMSFIAAANKL